MNVVVLLYTNTHNQSEMHKALSFRSEMFEGEKTLSNQIACFCVSMVL